MATRSLGTLTLDLVAKTGGYIQGLTKSERQTARWHASIRKYAIGTEKEFVNLSQSSIKQLTVLNTNLIASAKALGTAFSARQVINYADSYTNLQNRIKSVTDNSAELSNVTSRLFEISKEALTPVDTAAKLYQKLALGTQGFARTQEELFRVVTTVAKAGALANDGIQSYNASLIQLGQAFGGDFKSAAQEFNSINEQTPFIAKAIADGLGTIPPALKAMAEAGELNSEKIFKALLKTSDSVDDTFSGITKNTSQALGVLNSATTQYIGETNKTLGATSAISDSLITISENIDLLAKSVVALSLVFTGRLVGSLNATQKQTLITSLAMLIQRKEVVGLGSATGVYTARLTAATVASNLFAVAGTALRGTLSLLGGPFGLLTIVAGGLFLYTQRAKEASDETKLLIDKYDSLATGLNKTRLTLVNKDILDAEQKLANIREEQSDNVSILGLATGSAAKKQRELNIEETKAISVLSKLQAKRRGILEDIDKQNQTKAPIVTIEDKDTKKAIDRLAKFRDQLKQQAETLGKDDVEIIKYRLSVGDLSDDLRDAGAAGDALSKSIINNAIALKSATDKAETSKQYQELTSDLSNQKLQLLLNEKELFIYQAQMKLGANATKGMREEVAKLAGSLFDEKQFQSIRESLLTPEDEIRRNFKEQKQAILAGTKNNEEERRKLLARLRQETNKQLQETPTRQLVDSLLTEEDLIRQSYKRRKQLILDNTELTSEQQKELILRAEQDKQAALAEQYDKRLELDQNLFSGLAGLAKAYAGEQSGIYRALFAVEKAVAVARSIVAIQTAIAEASANPFPANLEAISSVISATAGIVSTISGTNIEGVAHSGLDSVPTTGTYLLQKGERVTTERTSAKLDKTLSQVQQNQSSPASGGNIRIVNAFDNQVIGDYMGSDSGEQVIMNAVRRNQATIQQIARG